MNSVNSGEAFSNETDQGTVPLVNAPAVALVSENERCQPPDDFAQVPGSWRMSDEPA